MTFQTHLMTVKLAMMFVNLNTKSKKLKRHVFIGNLRKFSVFTL